jgi:hypothetical protein
MAIGFSHSTWHPAFSAARVSGAWNLFGVATLRVRVGLRHFEFSLRCRQPPFVQIGHRHQLARGVALIPVYMSASHAETNDAASQLSIRRFTHTGFPSFAFLPDP